MNHDENCSGCEFPLAEEAALKAGNAAFILDETVLSIRLDRARAAASELVDALEGAYRESQFDGEYVQALGRARLTQIEVAALIEARVK